MEKILVPFGFEKKKLLAWASPEHKIPSLKAVDLLHLKVGVVLHLLNYRTRARKEAVRLVELI
jgi:hypothetical protein